MSGAVPSEAASVASALVPLPVILPLAAAGLKLTIGLRLQRTQRVISTVVLAVVLVVSAVLLVVADQHGPQVMYAGGWAPPVGIVLVADRLSALMLLVSSAVTLCVLLYSIGQGMADREGATPLSVFHPSYLVLVAGVSNTFLAGDLFNLYVGFEIMLTASYVLLTLGGTISRIRAGATYTIVSLLSSVLFLAAIAMVYAAAGTVNMAELPERLDALPQGVRTLIQISLLTVFGIKAAVFPLAAWLPDSYPTAPAPVTAVFAGLLTKVGVYAMLRTQTLLFPGGRLDDVLMIVALLSMVIGILGAVAQTDLKRMLSFTLISHMGYMVFGIGLASPDGLSGAVFYVAHHITVQTTLFLVAGLVERRGGSTDLQRLGGLATLSPMLTLLFFIPAMNLAGIPPLSGFLGKLGLLRAGVADGSTLSYVLVAGGTLTSLLTLYAVAKAWNLAFWRAAPPELSAIGTVLDSEETDEETEEAEAEAVTGAGGAPATAPAAPGGPPAPEGAKAAGDARGGADPAAGVRLAKETPEASAAVPVPDAEPEPRPAGNAGTASFGGQAITTTSVLPRSMVGSTVALVAFGLAFTVLAGSLFGLTDRIADELMERSPYVSAVIER
ncbi:Na+/H+ antiporter subunit D [Streptomyces sp. AJS327]|uniref:Na+/H+ antiporter subunit D n=1 Tax=Streptomyces sp. AJS327 TaxID=2545265 RepID=UPI0015DD5FB2|nr:Na+/H+ antiporter subunit D [Streptomyces sp. AJS327]MBA0050383.1 Na+/H+ antiporter subunit D [Streptomyces sp. AJS327]